MAKRWVVLTGATGTVSHKILPALRDRYELVLLDVADTGHHGERDDVRLADLSDPDLEQYRTHFVGADTVIHNAFVRDPKRTSHAPLQWLDEQPPGDPDGYLTERTDVDMAFHVYKLALEEGVRRVIMTSSNHAADFYETQLHAGKRDYVSPEDPPLTDNFYGWAKVAYEQMGFVFATGRFGRPLENVQIRVGAPRRIAGARYDGQPTTFKRIYRFDTLPPVGLFRHLRA